MPENWIKGRDRKCSIISLQRKTIFMMLEEISPKININIKNKMNIQAEINSKFAISHKIYNILLIANCQVYAECIEKMT